MGAAARRAAVSRRHDVPELQQDIEEEALKSIICLLIIYLCFCRMAEGK
jgi:hypothetical protein